MRRILERHNLTLAGLNQHIGSLFMEPDSYNGKPWSFFCARRKQWDSLEVIDFGGGFGIPYRKYEKQPRLDMEATGRMLDDYIGRWADRTGYNGRFMIEPGRYVTAECGVVLGTVHAVKNNGERRFAGTDLGVQRSAAVRSCTTLFMMWEIYREDGVPQQETMQPDHRGQYLRIRRYHGCRPRPARDTGRRHHRHAGCRSLRFCHEFQLQSASCVRPKCWWDKDGRDRLIRRRETLDDLLACFPEYAEKTGGFMCGWQADGAKASRPQAAPRRPEPAGAVNENQKYAAQRR